MAVDRAHGFKSVATIHDDSGRPGKTLEELLKR
jgi:hypothetical protein